MTPLWFSLGLSSGVTPNTRLRSTRRRCDCLEARGLFVADSHTFPERPACSCGTLRSEMAVPKLLVTRSDEVMSGAVVFTGTRVPVETLLDYLEEGDTLDHFLEDFPTVSREHAVAVLELDGDRI